MAGPMSLLDQLDTWTDDELQKKKRKPVVRDGNKKVYDQSPEINVENYPELDFIDRRKLWSGLGPAPREFNPEEVIYEMEQPKPSRNVKNLFKKDYGTGMTGDIPDSFSPEKKFKIFRQETGINPSVLDDEEYEKYTGPPFNLPRRYSMMDAPTNDGVGPSEKRWGGEEVEAEVSEEVDIDGTSYEDEEVLEKIKGSGGEKRISTPRTDPQKVLVKSRESGEPWQDILVQHYMDANPFLDQHRVRKAIYNVADKHYEQWKKDGSKGDYNKKLSNSFKSRGSGRGSSRKGSRRSKGGGRKNLATSMLSQDPELKRMVDILGDAKSFSGDVSRKEMGKFYEKIAQGSDGEIEDAGAAEIAMKKSLGKKELNADTYVNTMMRMYDTGPEDQKKKYNRSAVQSMVTKKLVNNLYDRYQAGDEQVIEAVDQYKTGKKAGRPAFNQAAKDIFLRYKLDDVSLTRGRRGAGDEYRRKEKNK